MIDQLQALWRPATGFVMSGIVLAVALGWLPESSQHFANEILTAAGGVLAALTASRAVQRVQEVKAQSQPYGLPLEAIEGLKRLGSMIDSGEKK